MIWLRAQWKWLLAGLAIFLAFVGGILASRRKETILLPPVDKEQKEIEKETEIKRIELEVKKSAEVVRLKDEYAQTIEKLNKEQKQRFEELKEQPDELSGWLLELGKKNRG